MKKLLEISSFYTYLLKMTVIWCTAPEIWSATEFLSFWGPFFLIWNILLHMSTINEGHMIHGSWNIMCNTEFFVILGHFLLFHPLTTQKIKVLKNWLMHNKWQSYDLCIFLFCHFLLFYPPNNPEDHMMYGSWDMEQDKQIFFFSFLVVFCSFTTLKLQNQNFWKKDKTLEISSFYTRVPKVMIICYTVP